MAKETISENLYLKYELYWTEANKWTKDWAVLVAVLIPAAIALFNFISPSQWEYIASNQFQLVYLSVSAVIVYTLVLVEAWGDKIKRFKYYSCVTYFIYDAIMIWSLAAYMDAFINIRPFMYWQNNVLLLASFIGCWIHFCLLWIWDSSDSIEMIRHKVFGTNLKVTQGYEEIGTPSINSAISRAFQLAITWGYPIIGFGYIFEVMSHGGIRNSEFVIFIETAVMMACLLVRNANIIARVRMPEIVLVTISMVIFYAALPIACRAEYRNVIENDHQISQARFIFFWMTCISIGRRWFLDIEIFSSKMENRGRRTESMESLMGIVM